jgi:hypothetical protein
VRLQFAFAGLFAALILVAAPACADERAGAIYDQDMDAAAAIDAALAEAATRQVPALLVFGANWCHDSRGLAHTLTTHEALAPYAAGSIETVFIDVGTRSRNLDQLARFGVEEIFGTPTLVIATPEGETLNAGSVHHWRTAYDAAPADIAAYLAAHGGAAPAIRAEASARQAEIVAGWPPYEAALADLAERVQAGDISEEDAARRGLFYLGFARSMARLALGREAAEQELDAADAGVLEALGLSADIDLTETVAARLAEMEPDLIARADSALGADR